MSLRCVVMLSFLDTERHTFVMLSTIILNVVMPSFLDTERHTFVMLSTIILNVVMPCVIMLIVIYNNCRIFIFILCDGMSSVIIMSVDRLNDMAPLTLVSVGRRVPRADGFIFLQPTSPVKTHL